MSDVDCEQGIDCQLGVGQCEACRLNALEIAVESAILQAELAAEIEEAETQG
jgi:hypothetical protein